MAACTTAGAAEPLELAPLDAAELVRFEAALNEAHGPSSRIERDACLNSLEPVRDLAWRHRVAARGGGDWLVIWAHCMYRDPTTDAAPRSGLTAPQIDAQFRPWLERFRRPGPIGPGAEMQHLRSYWATLNWIGEREAADAMFIPALRGRIERAALIPPDPTAIEDVEHLARLMNGTWALQDYVREFHAMYRDRLGPGHRATLLMQRTMAYHERFLGRPQSALQLIEEAVALADREHPQDEPLRIGLRAERAACLGNAGRPADAMFDALVVRDAVLRRTPPDDTALVRSHTHLAGLALEMGDDRAAIAHADQAIAYARVAKAAETRWESIIPEGIRAVARLNQGEPGAADELRAVVDRGTVPEGREMHIGFAAFEFVRHAVAAFDDAQLAWSVGRMRDHIAIFRTAYHPDRALIPLMQAWQLAGTDLREPAVRPDLDLALATSLAGRSLATESLTEFSLARHLRRTQIDEAVWLYKRGANALQALRTGLPSGESELHRAWLATHERDLRDFIGLLIDTGRLTEAEQAVRFLRDEEVVEYTRRSRSRPRAAVSVSASAAVQPLSYTVAEADRNVGFDALARRVALAAKASDQRADARRNYGYLSQHRDDQAAAELAGFQQEVHDLLLPTAAPAAGRSAPRGAASAVLPAGTARLTYFMRETQLDIVLQIGRRYRSATVPIGRAELNRQVQALRAAVGTPERDAMPAARSLHKLLVAPVAGWLKAARTERLRIVPDASLRYVPFAALHDGRRFLGQRVVLSTEFAATADDAIDPYAAHTTARGVLAFGRSLGDAEHEPLPGVVRELAALPRGDTTVALDAAFTAQSLRAGLERSPAIVHLASHFSIDPAGEERSTLLLGDGQSMSLSALRQLPWQGVRLALLSACDSAVAIDGGQGREMAGFANALRQAGVRNVLATLWRVSDGATAQWMEMFYAPFAAPRRPPLSADLLARTQRRWLARHAGKDLAHPHYWAAFNWIGPD